MNSTTPLISVIIPHLNQLEYLEHCLASLDAQTVDTSQFEVIVVDNGSVASPEAIISRHANARLLHEREPGPGPARNTGIRNAKADVLALIDADCRAHSDWLASALQFLRTSPEKTILGGDVRIWHERMPPTAIAAYESVFAYRFKLYIEQYGFAGTGNLAVKRKDFLAIGPFAGIALAEDMEWGRRASSSGYHFRYVPEMIVFHPARTSMHELRLKWDRQIQHALNQARGRHGWRIRWIARAVAVLLSPAVDFMKVLRSDRIEGASTRLKAIAVLVDIRLHRCLKMIRLLWQSQLVVWNRASGI